MADWFPKDLTYFDFIRAFIPPLAGAFFGAWAAQRIAARNKRHDDQVKELAFTGMTSAMAYGVTDAFIGVKKSSVKPMFDHWDADRRRREEHFQNGATVPFEFDADFRTLTPVKASLDQLRTLVFANIRLDARAVQLMTTLDRCIDQHNAIIAENNRLVALFEKDKPDTGELAARLFGIRVGTRVDDRYSSTIRALHSGTDDCIMFSRLLGDELTEHGKRLAAKLPKEMRGSYTKFDFSKAEAEGLMPNPEDFSSWLPVPPAPPPPVTVRERIKRAWHALSE